MASPQNQATVRDMLSRGMSTLSVWNHLTKVDDPRLALFSAVHEVEVDEVGGFGGGAAGASVHAMRFASFGGRIYSFTEQLVELLTNTKLGTDIPVSELRLPAPNIFIELGADRSRSPLKLHHPQSGEHALEGAYVSSVKDEAGNPWLEVTLTGSPVGRDHLMDDAVEWASLRAGAEESIVSALNDAYARPVTAELKSSYFDDQARLLGGARTALPKLELIAKCILFLGLPDTIQHDVLDAAAARAVVQRTKSGKHMRRALRDLARSYDRVIVDAKPAAADENLSAPGVRTMETHWREGHFRSQRHGPALSLVKVIWIRPVWVNAGSLHA